MASLETASASAILLSPWVIGPAVFVLWVTLLPIVKRIAFAMIRRRLPAPPRLAWADAMLDALSPAALILIWVTGLAILLRIMPTTPRWQGAVSVGLDAGIAIAVIVFFDRWAPPLLQRLGARSPAVAGEYGLIRGVTRVVIIALGALMFLDTIGVSITPILASLGVGSIAVALALQDTLANLFAGIYIAADKPIEPGDFVRLETGQEGYLTRLGWRSSHIRILPAGAVVVPNSKLAQSVLTNFTLANGDAALAIDITVAATSDLDRVKAVTLEVAREVMRTVSSPSSCHQPERSERSAPSAWNAANLATNPSDASIAAAEEPSVRFQGFAGATVKLTVGLRTSADAATIRHEFIKRLRARYERESITLA